jgi:microcystin-dependent protein
MPRKRFQDLDILTAAEINDYLMDQSVQTFSSIANRDASIPPAERKAGMVAYAVAEKDLSIHDGAAWEPVGGMPRGGIIMWSGLVTAVPDGWALCDGLNGTPDLRGRFIVGASQDTGGTNTGASYNRAAVGGADAVALTVAQLPAHTHSMAASGVHDHNTWWRQILQSGGTSAALALSNSSGVSQTNLGVENSGSHTHAINNTGSGATHENRPRFYSLAYIQRL